MPEEMRMMPDPASPTGYSLKPVYRPPTPLEIARGTLNNYADILGSYLTQQAAPRPSQFGRILQGMGYGQTPETVQAQQQRIQNLPLPMENRIRNAITQGVDYAGNFLAQGRAPEIGGAVRSMVEPVAQFPVTAVTDPLKAATQAQQVLDPAYAMARGLTTTRLGAEQGNLGDVAAGVTEMGLAGLSFVPGGAAVKGARAMPPAPIRRPPPIGQPNVLAPQASRGPILNQLADQPAATAATAPDVAALKRQGFNTDKVYYHGTYGDEFDTFDMAKVGRREIPWYGEGAYLSPDRDLAKSYGNKVMPFYVRGKLLTVDRNNPWPEWLKKGADVKKELADRGYVGLQINNTARGFKRDNKGRLVLDEQGQPIDYESSMPETVVFDPANIVRADKGGAAMTGASSNILATPPEVGGAFVGGALGATQGETPEERARNALLGAAGGALGGRMARGITPDKTRMGSNLGNVPKPVQKAQAAGYEGADIGEAQEWVQARSKGLDMSQPARLKRAEELGFDTGTVLYHGTADEFTAFDPEELGKATGGGGTQYGFFLTDSPQQADDYRKLALGFGEGSWHKAPRDQGRVIELMARGNYMKVDMPALERRLAEEIGVEYDGLPEILGPQSEWMGQLVRQAKREGFDGVDFVNILDDPMFGYQGTRATHRLVFNPSNIRSTNAAFDPASKQSANILAGVGAVGAGAAMTGAIRPPERKKPPGQRPRG